MAREIVPINDRPAHMVEAGRLRMGERKGRAMAALKHWRLTTPKRELLDGAAALYGGTVRPWHEQRANPPHQFELYTETDTLDVAVVPGGFSAWYEEWGGGGVLKRCDGTTCSQPVRVGDDEVEMIEVPCICRAQQAMACKPYVRLSVVLPRVPFAGVWRLETKSWNALDEIAAMEAMIMQLQAHGITEARLTINQRKTVIAGRTRHYVVPVLWVPHTPEDIALGRGSLRALSSSTTRELNAGDAPPTDAPQTKVGPPGPDRGPENEDWFEDAEIVDAELVENTGQDEQVPAQTKTRHDKMVIRLAIMCGEKAPEPKDSDDLRHAVAWKVSGARVESTKELTEQELHDALDRVEKARPGQIAGLLAEYRGRDHG